MRYVMVVTLWSFIGAVTSVFVMFMYRAYILASHGADLAAVPLSTMLLEVMELHRFALYGALGGALLGVMSVVYSLLSRPKSTTRPGARPTSIADVDQTIRAMREKRAAQYLAGRKQGKADTR